MHSCGDAETTAPRMTCESSSFMLSLHRRSRMRRVLVLAFLGCGITISSFASVASADDAAWDRHPRHATRATMPVGVPAEYVLTHSGFFHPSCVVSIRSDEIWGRDSVIR